VFERVLCLNQQLTRLERVFQPLSGRCFRSRMFSIDFGREKIEPLSRFPGLLHDVAQEPVD